ncbi:MAG: DUF1501 domain-containing protein [Planctomycetaceae bacterium]|nr:DUF1501 domain-containing protein [Planctomycetaceae bacterium]
MLNNNLLSVSLNHQGLLTRRDLLRLSGAGFAGLSAMGLLQRIGLSAERLKQEGRACIMVFLNGAPSQLETFDPKPGQENGGPTKTVQTSISGVHFAEYWRKLAGMMQDLSVIRSMHGKEAAHDRGVYHLKTGRRLTGVKNFPHFGALVADKLGDPDADVPNFVSIGRTLSAGFLGVRVAPFTVDKAGQLPANVSSGLPQQRIDRRLELLHQQDSDFAKAGATAISAEHQELYDRAARLMTAQRLKAFTLNGESDAVKAAYGNHAFGQGCLVARRLVESGVPFVEVQKGGWDMHQDLWQKMPANAAEVDQGLSQLVSDLKQRGLLDKTLVICLGEFGRTPKINQRTPTVGRDHWARNFNLLIGGGGIKGGVCFGETNSDGVETKDRPVEVDDLFATMCTAMGIDPDEELISNEGRPLRIVDDGTAVKELLG